MPLDRRPPQRWGLAPRTLPGALLLTVLALGGLSGCADSEPLAHNVILISVDTLRPDHLGCYGYERPTSPNLDALCEESVVFEQAISHAPSTLPSHASMLTSLLPHQHGASIGERRPLADELTTLPEVLKDRGYRTASFNDGAQMDARWGLAQGFDRYDSTPGEQHRLQSVASRALAWIEESGPETPFFLLLHTYEVHHPYTPSPEDLTTIGALSYDGWLGESVEIRELQKINGRARLATPEDLAFIEATYDAEIRSMDRALGRFLSTLEDRGLLENTLLIFTSDHGEEFNEHGQVGWHGHTLFDELLKVPLVIRFPGELWSGQRLRRQVRLVDLAPTILDALGLQVPSRFRGISLLPILEGEEVQPLLAVSKVDGDDVFSLRTGNWKLYRERLYDLRQNPSEEYDAMSGNWELYNILTAELRRIAAEGSLHAADSIDLDSDARKSLEALGYL